MVRSGISFCASENFSGLPVRPWTNLWNNSVDGLAVFVLSSCVGLFCLKPFGLPNSAKLVGS